ncbi:MAG: integrase core domain-containing protein [Dehalococcoidia bacterium]
MSTFGSVIPGAARLAGVGRELSPDARRRLKWMDYHVTHGRNVSRTCRYFGIARKTFYVWWKRYRPYDLRSLEARARRPIRVRQPDRPPALVTAVQRLREQYPRWGKDKLAVLLRQVGWTVSTSMVGRILSDLQRRGLLREPVRLTAARRRAGRRRRYAVRKPKDYTVRAPGDLVQFDTQLQHPEPGITLRHFAARDMVSRYDVLAVHTRGTASLARDHLQQVLARMPFPIRAAQIDGGSEYKAEFEAACEALGVRLFVLPPKSPKLNGRVERSHRTHEEEFYQCYDGAWTLADLQPALRQWEIVYNTVRPHQALGYRTPAAFLAAWHRNENETVGTCPTASPSV